MQKLKISKRLKTIAKHLPEGAYFADIGSDHAYLPCFICSKDMKARAIAGELNRGPFHSAQETVANCQLTDRIDVRLGDGLTVLHEGEVLQLVIAGMGGSSIAAILEEGKKKLTRSERIIIQPNVNEYSVRKWLVDHGFYMADEDIVKENGHIYEIIAADRNPDSVLQHYTEKELLFGPLLLHKKDDIFIEKWQHQHGKLTRIIYQMKQAKIQHTEKMARLEKEQTWIEEVLHNETTD